MSLDLDYLGKLTQSFVRRGSNLDIITKSGETVLRTTTLSNVQEAFVPSVVSYVAERDLVAQVDGVASGGALVDASGQAYALPNPKDARNLYPLVNQFTQFQQKKKRAALAKQRAGARMKIAILGSSVEAGAWANGVVWAGNRPWAIANLVGTLLAGRGYTINVANVFGDSNSAPNATAVPYLAGTNAPVLTQGVGWFTGAGTPNFSVGANFWYHAVANTNRLSFAMPGTCDTCEITYCTGPAFGNLAIAIDGGAIIGAPIACAGTVGIATATRTFASGAHSIEVFENAGAASAIQVAAVKAYNSAAPAVEMWSWGWGGAKTADWADASLAFSPLNAIGHHAPHFTLIGGCNINDCLAGTPIATYKANMRLIANKCLLSGDIAFYSESPYGATQAGFENQALYTQALFELSVEYNVPFIDTFARFESWTEMVARGYSGADGIQVHPNGAGYWDQAFLIAPFIAP